MTKSDQSHRFYYQITEAQGLEKLIDTRFSRLLKRSNLSLNDFIEQRIQVNDQTAVAATELHPGDQISYLHFRSDETEYTYPIDIIYEDEQLLAIEKPDCLTVVPTTTHYFNSVLNLMKERLQRPDLSPLHRLDIESSGVLLFSKYKEDRSALQLLFENKQVNKLYQTLVYGKFDPTIKTISGDMKRNKSSAIYSKYYLDRAGQQTLTEIVEVNTSENFSELVVRPVSGFTNQIRCHLADLGHSIIGDKKYFPDEQVYLDWFATDHLDERMILDRQALHCREISFKHPFSGKRIVINSDSRQFARKLKIVRDHFTTR
ncbi:MAG: RluA family pseudouridine synthase [Calditrichaeota bacterium]|nr:RluA family pseudouridine synthase [Calditrichota bacterium]